jgi:hypothetical protein
MQVLDFDMVGQLDPVLYIDWCNSSYVQSGECYKKILKYLFSVLSHMIVLSESRGLVFK